MGIFDDIGNFFGDLFGDDDGGGGGGGAGGTAQTIVSQDSVEAILCVGEGPILGLEDGLKSFYVGETPLLDASGQPNFYDRNGGAVVSSFSLDTFYGTPEGQTVTSKLGWLRIGYQREHRRFRAPCRSSAPSHSTTSTTSICVF